MGRCVVSFFHTSTSNVYPYRDWNRNLPVISQPSSHWATLSCSNVMSVCAQICINYSNVILQVMRSVYRAAQDKVYVSVKEEGGSVKLAGDGRCDSPGHCALFGLYTLMDCSTSKILCTALVKVSSTCIVMRLFVQNWRETVFPERHFLFNDSTVAKW